MGFSSFLTTDTKQSIMNRHSGQETIDVYMVDDQGREWKESNYNGYCDFGGKDIFVLIYEMNTGETVADSLYDSDDVFTRKMNKDVDKCRNIGIDMYFSEDVDNSINIYKKKYISKKPKIKTPCLFTKPGQKWIDTVLDACPLQGYFADESI